MSKFITILLFLGWTAGSTWYYTCELKGLCESSESTAPKTENKEKTVSKKPKLSAPLAFRLNEYEIHTGPSWDELKDSLIHLCSEEKSYLNIVGQYYKNEAAPKGFRNMGLARAHAIKSELSKYTRVEKLRTSSELLESSNSDYWLECFTVNLGKEDKTQSNIVETNFGLIIYFPSGSAEALLTDRLIHRLDVLAKEMRANEGGANIVGHTDNQGTKISNYELGQKRALMIRDFFIEKGVNPENLRASSMGETQPNGDNSTEEGRSENRRIEITLNDNQ